MIGYWENSKNNCRVHAKKSKNLLYKKNISWINLKLIQLLTHTFEKLRT
jgi:hypothetical protein